MSIFRCVREIEIPAGVEVLCEECFRESGLSRVTFASGSRLKRIEKGAFLVMVTSTCNLGNCQPIKNENRIAGI